VRGPHTTQKENPVAYGRLVIAAIIVGCALLRLVALLV
jgi:hypothetical protein